MSEGKLFSQLVSLAPCAILSALPCIGSFVFFSLSYVCLLRAVLGRRDSQVCGFSGSNINFYVTQCFFFYLPNGQMCTRVADGMRSCFFLVKGFPFPGWDWGEVHPFALPWPKGSGGVA